MARTGAEGLATDSAFRHPLEAMTRLSQRTPLRIKLITALLALVALALAVISFTSVAVFSGYLENQVDTQVQTLAAQTASGNPPNPHQSDHRIATLGFVYEFLDAQGNVVPTFGNGQAIGPIRPRPAHQPLVADRACGAPGDRAGLVGQRASGGSSSSPRPIRCRMAPRPRGRWSSATTWATSTTPSAT